MNKGDELMLRSVMDQLESEYDIELTTDLKMEQQEVLEEFLRLTFSPGLAVSKNAMQDPSLKSFYPLQNAASFYLFSLIGF